MNKKKIVYFLIVVMVAVAVAGCGTKAPDIDMEVKWNGLKGLVPYMANDMGINDSRSIEVVVENKDKVLLDGLILRIDSNIPNLKTTPTQVNVMALGPEGTSKTNPSVFKIETINTPPGKYSIWISAEYNGQTIKNKKIDVDIG